MANLLVNEYDLYDKEFLAARTGGPSLVDRRSASCATRRENGKALYWDLADNTAKPYDEVKEPALEGNFEVDGIPVRTAFSIFKDSVAKYTPEYAEGHDDPCRHRAAWPRSSAKRPVSAEARRGGRAHGALPPRGRGHVLWHCAAQAWLHHALSPSCAEHARGLDVLARRLPGLLHA